MSHEMESQKSKLGICKRISKRKTPINEKHSMKEDIQ